MYTRSYTDDIGEILIPEKYGGTSFTQSAVGDDRTESTEGARNPWEKADIHTDQNDTQEDNVQTSATPTRSPGLGFLSGLFKNGNFSLQKIGKEEILIIATAVFLLLSKEGDKECAIMLLLLLFLG